MCSRRYKSDVSQSGGWCKDSTNTNHMTDTRLATSLTELFAGSSVVSLGEGLGNYKALILATGQIKRFDAFDGTPGVAQLTNGQVQFLDLTLPQYWLDNYDWVMSLEVLEHIPARHELTAVDNLVRIARRGIVLSWGSPGQNGYHHVNNRPQEYIHRVMKERGFTSDVTATQSLRQSAEFFWFKNNILVFRRIQPNISKH